MRELRLGYKIAVRLVGLPMAYLAFTGTITKKLASAASGVCVEMTKTAKHLVAIAAEWI